MKRFSLSFVVAATLMSLAAAKGAYPLVGSEKPATPQPPAQSITKAVEEASLSELSGTVVETMNAGGYTYVCLEKKGKKTWAAVPEMRVKVGQKLTLAPGAEMTNFKSTKLNRTFEKIIFSTGPLAARGPSPSPRDTSSPSGKVVETMNAGGYTYVCLEKKGKKTWVAVPEMAVSVGQKLTFRPGVEMTNFTSKKLNRTFDRIIFSDGTASSNTSTAAKAEKLATGGSKAAVVASTDKIRVEKATGPDAYTVAELYGDSSKLDSKTVVVRGKVVKVSAGIMGVNWIHLQDGTGDQTKGTHDIVVTSKELPSVGDVVTAKGTLHKDKDFGYGYKYEVIVEKATFTK